MTKTQGAGRLPAAEAFGHRGGLQSDQEPERQPAICHPDLTPGWPSDLAGKGERGSHCSLGDPVELLLYAIASLALISVGLAIIFGMMRVINLAHGEFLMLGGYAAIVATSHGISIWIAILVVAPVVVGILGVIIERTIIRFLYGRMIDTMLGDLGT